MKKIVFLLSVILFSGCATGYNQDGTFGGYSESPAPGKLKQIHFRSNGFLSRQEITEYLLMRCAEITINSGKRYFVIYKDVSSAISDVRANAPRIKDKYTYVYLLPVENEGNNTFDANVIFNKK